MKLTCNMMDDLLPLYIEEACSEDSRLAVEEHLAECSACRSKLQRMQQDNPSVSTPSMEQIMKRYSKKMRRRKVWNVLRDILVVVLVILLSVVVYVYESRLVIGGEPTEIRMIHYYQDAPGTSMSDNRTDITFSDRETVEAIMDEISGTYTLELFPAEYFQSALDQHEFCITIYGLGRKIDFHVTDKGWIRIDDTNYTCTQRDALEMYENLMGILEENK